MEGEKGFFQGIAVFVCATISLAAYILVAFSDYTLLLYVQGSSNFPCSCQKNFLETLKKSMLNSFLRVP